jgi:hypothetical protein
LETTYFSKLFRAIVGIPYADWMQTLTCAPRETDAGNCGSFDHSDRSAVGYMDVTTFDRAFRRVEGTCPREYRRLLQRDRASNTRNAELNARNAETTTNNAPYLEESFVQS